MLVDPSYGSIDTRGLLRAMQHCCLGSETGSQTNAVVAAVHVAHYVLRHHNHEVLPLAQVTAAAAVAAVRGNVAYVALVGDAAVYAWRSGRLTGQRTPTRVGRPLGLDQEPRVTLWSTPLRPGDRLVLVCGATWREDTDECIAEVLSANPSDVAERHLAELLGGQNGPARVLIDDGTAAARPSGEPRRRTIPPGAPRTLLRSAQPRWRRWLASVVPLVVLGAGALALLGPTQPPQHLALRAQAESLLAQAANGGDLYQAHALASTAYDVAQRAASLAPSTDASLVMLATETLEHIDRVVPVQPRLVVRLGPTGGNVVDLAVSEDRLFTLDVVEGAVRGFGASGLEQWPTPETLLVRKGAALGGRYLDTPVAIQYVVGARPGSGALTIVDRARTIAQLLPSGALSVRPLASSASWQRLGALGADAEGNLFVLDSGAPRLLEYPGASQRLVDPPNPLLEGRLDMASVAEILPLHDIFMRMQDGRVRRLGRDGQELGFDVRPPDGRLNALSALAPDRNGGLYLADTQHARVLHATADGRFIRQLRDPALAGVRQLQTSPDGRRLYGLVATGILAFDVPELLDT
jgi:hypothetical protein